MLHQVAIMKRHDTDDVANADEVLYGPVLIIASRCEDTAQIANRVIAQAANDGKIPGGWTSRHYVVGLSFSHYT